MATPPSPDDVGLAAKAMGALGTAMSILGGWFIKDTRDKINELERTTIKQQDFDRHVAQASRERGEIIDEQHVLRANQAKIFDKIAELDDKSTERHIELLKAIGRHP